MVTAMVYLVWGSLDLIYQVLLLALAAALWLLAAVLVRAPAPPKTWEKMHRRVRHGR